MGEFMVEQEEGLTVEEEEEGDLEAGGEEHELLVSL